MIRKGNEVVLNVRPVVIGFEHLYYYEGPCRFGKGEALQPGYDRLVNAQKTEEFMANLRRYAPEGVNIMDPVCGSRTDDWDNSEEMWDRFKEAILPADYLVVFCDIGVDELTIEMCQRFRKPMAITPMSAYSTPTLCAAIGSRNLCEFKGFMKWEDLGYYLGIMRARKVMQSTRVMLVSRMNSQVSKSSVDTFISHDAITDRLGVQFRYVNLHELLDDMQPACEEGNYTTPGRRTWNLDDNDMAEIEKLADELMNNAAEVQVDRKYLINSLKAYYTVKKRMDFLDCNAFTVPCPDACSTRRINQGQFTFCLTHTLNMENGIPSACEYDVDAVLSEQALIAVSRKFPYMGNTSPLPMEGGKFQWRFGSTEEGQAKLMSDPANVYLMQHSVAHRRISDPEKTSPFALRHFAYDQKWGAVMRHDFDKDAGQTMTVCRFSPDGKKLFIGKGTVICGDGYDLDNCNNLVYFRVEDQKKFFEAQNNVGNHLAMVYGDYTQQLRDLAASLNVEVVEPEK